MATVKGQFVWHELMTTDLAGAKDFYAHVAGWKGTRFGQLANYEVWNVGEESIGGVMLLPEEAKQAGVPPHWIGYIQTDDVDATAKKAQELGGAIVVPPIDIPTVGRFAVLTDPQGAAFAAFKPLEAMTVVDRHVPGQFSWGELNTTDYVAASKFYVTLFDWKNTATQNLGPELGDYWMFGVDEKQSMGGMSNAAAVMKAPPHWLHYITVDDIHAAVERIKSKGGKVLNGPMEVPGGDLVAQCMDPQGAAFAIYAPGKR